MDKRFKAAFRRKAFRYCKTRIFINQSKSRFIRNHNSSSKGILCIWRIRSMVSGNRGLKQRWISCFMANIFRFLCRTVNANVWRFIIYKIGVWYMVSHWAWTRSSLSIRLRSICHLNKIVTFEVGKWSTLRRIYFERII